jgi:hypothetical protein
LQELSGGSVTLLREPEAAAEGADVIYTDTWTSMGQEEEAKKREKVFPPYQVNQAFVNLAKPTVIVLHCLPAHRGQEITDEVADGPHSRLFPQAENRMHAQKAILVELLLGGDPDAKIANILSTLKINMAPIITMLWMLFLLKEKGFGFTISKGTSTLIA